MAYTKTTWQNGDLITAEKMNNIEDGIVSSFESLESAENLMALPTMSSAGNMPSSSFIAYRSYGLNNSQKELRKIPFSFLESYFGGEVTRLTLDPGATKILTIVASKIYIIYVISDKMPADNSGELSSDASGVIIGHTNSGRNLSYFKVGADSISLSGGRLTTGSNVTNNSQETVTLLIRTI